MPFSASLSRRHVLPAFARRALAFALMATTTLPLARAGFAAVPPTPPDFPDAAHVTNGCYLSTVAFIAQFASAFPAERAQPATIRPRNFDTPHTLALLTWQGRWWGRDEYAGIFPLDRPVGGGTLTESLRRHAERIFEKRSIAQAKLSGYNPANTEKLSPARRAHDVTVAAGLIPFRTERFSLRCGDQDVPLLFFRPTSGSIAVYDPVTGTATAETAITSSSAIVKLVATQLGYRVDAIRAEPLALMLLAVADSPATR